MKAKYVLILVNLNRIHVICFELFEFAEYCKFDFFHEF